MDRRGTGSRPTAGTLLTGADQAGGRSESSGHPNSEGWTVAKVCDSYLINLHQTAHPEWADQVGKWLRQHESWTHNTQRIVIGSVITAFSYCCRLDDLVVNPVAVYVKPAATPRVTAFSPE